MQTPCEPLSLKVVLSSTRKKCNNLCGNFTLIVEPLASLWGWDIHLYFQSQIHANSIKTMQTIFLSNKLHCNSTSFSIAESQNVGLVWRLRIRCGLLPYNGITLLALLDMYTHLYTAFCSMTETPVIFLQASFGRVHDGEPQISILPHLHVDGKIASQQTDAFSHVKG